mmetsp:Transcript_2811/g.6714  ORF Transcript_2811/g.6714 Transcript_2811/m.6714 type:complete len:414 (+) Transcript_2811:22-1263(+)
MTTHYSLVNSAANRLGDQYYLVKQACDEYVTNHGKDTLSKQQLDYILGRFNVILPEVAFEKFWETIASSGEAEVSVSQFLQKLKPKQPPNVRAAGLRAKDMPSAFASSPKKPKKLFNWNPAELGPIPIWDNEWRQEQDENLGAPTMTGIMSGAYYFQRSQQGSSKVPRQEWDYEMRAPLATVLIEGKFYGGSEKDIEDMHKRRRQERAKMTALIRRNKQVVKHFSELMSESRSQQQSAQSSQRSTPRSLQFTPRAVQGAVQGAGKLRLPFSADRTRANSFEEAMRQFKSSQLVTARPSGAETSRTRESKAEERMSLDESRKVRAIVTPRASSSQPSLFLKQAFQNVRNSQPEEAMSAARLSPARPKTAYLGTPRQTTPRLGGSRPASAPTRQLLRSLPAEAAAVTVEEEGTSG